MAVESILLLAEEAGQTKIRDLQVSRRADEEVGGLQVLAADRKRFIVEGNIKTLFLKNERSQRFWVKQIWKAAVTRSDFDCGRLSPGA